MVHIEEFKSLFLKDLCGRLPYGVKIHLETPEFGELIGTLDAVYPTDDRVIVDNLDKAIAHINVRCGGFNIEENECKPYLRPMSSMTDEELYEFSYLMQQPDVSEIKKWLYSQEMSLITFEDSLIAFDWINAHHFDYRGLIEKGLAFEAPKGMYNLNEK